MSKGANIHDKDNYGRSSIVMASEWGHADVVELILSKGANFYDKNKYGRSSIVMASEWGHADVVELLLSKGANIHDKDRNGRSSLMVALDYSYHFNNHNHLYTDVVLQLLAHGADIPPIRSSYTPVSKLILGKWPVLMGILALQGLSLYYILDASTIIDLYQYLGEEREL